MRHMKTAYLTLADGTVFKGQSFGAEKEVIGEVVFTTAMTGYLETLTDPSYHGQIVLQTFPLIGNYGIIKEDFESHRIQPTAYIVKHPCSTPSNFRSSGDIGAFLKQAGIPGLCGIDTRQLTKIIRTHGVINGKITFDAPATEKELQEVKNFSIMDALSKVSLKDDYDFSGDGKYKVVLIDYGAKRNIAKELIKRGCSVKVMGHDVSAQEVMAQNPHGIMLSNGPGDPDDPKNAPVIQTIKTLQETGIPIFGICLGHQLMALANGYKTKKMRFGNRGSNQSAKELATGRVYITSQNHGYAVEAENPSWINVNDGSCEGIDYGVSFSVQFHPEACGGPWDTTFLFDRFIERMTGRFACDQTQKHMKGGK